MLALLTLVTLLPALAQEPATASASTSASTSAATSASNSPSVPTAAPPAAQSEKGSAMAGAAGLDVLWASRLSEAVEGARRMRDGRILIFFVEPDCGQCKRMEALVAPSTSFYAYTRDKVPLYEDVSTAEGKDLARRLRIRGTPTWIVVTPDLLECGRQEGPTTQQGWVEAFVQVERGWAGYRKVLADEAADPSDPRFVFEAARQTYQRGGGALAEARFQRLARDSKTPAPIREQALGYLTSLEMESGRWAEAVDHLDTLVATAQDAPLRMRAELRRADVEIARGRKDLAAWRLKEFLRVHADSPLAAEAKALLDALQGKAPVADPAANPAPREH